MDAIKEHEVVLWLRFVDDILLFFKDISKSTELLEYLNSKHPNIKFTEEKETIAETETHELPFLDVLVSRNSETGIQTSVYRKKTFTGTYLHWTSLTPRDYKIGLINCLLDRAYRICSTEQALFVTHIINGHFTHLSEVQLRCFRCSYSDNYAYNIWYEKLFVHTIFGF